MPVTRERSLRGPTDGPDPLATRVTGPGHEALARMGSGRTGGLPGT